MPIHNQNIVITGAASGIGKELVAQLSALDNCILAVDIDLENLQELKHKYPEIESLCLDLTHIDNLTELFTWININWKKVDIIFANAGYAKYGSWKDLAADEFEKLLRINTLIPIETAKLLGKTQPDYSFRLVITASAMSFWHIPGYAAYAASKAALHQFAETIWSEGDGNWLTLVYPIATKTQFFEKAGHSIPKAFPVQSVEAVAKIMIRGVAKGKTRIFPSRTFRIIQLVNRILPVFKPIYLRLERSKFENWTYKTKK
ncbi:SDR family NAD(P)-dependent oxidoreductase [Aquiflexum lacus]|uniref:SDR family NAD(P)-dependent oxidoreductase n=1 Tax=Aquiflexum lacus TaxID=2483805 RepID=UPI001892F739|nr:SDR family NAD(P)-dependent oxidoreductase [Aquiflexum lacus]